MNTPFPRAVPALVLALVACALAPGALAAECTAQPLPSFDVAGKGVGWAHVPLSKLKRDSKYAVTREGSATILTATAVGAASAFVHLASADPKRTPMLEWRWRVDALIDGADNADPKKEDAPVRIIVGFSGDKATLPDKEQRRFSVAKKVSGRDAPFATLMYIWANGQPVDTVIPSAHTSQLKMIVVESGPAGLGAWHDYRRNLVEDYRRAFGSEPGRIVGFAAMTDTDNTGATAEGFYGEIRLGCADPTRR